MNWSGGSHSRSRATMPIGMERLEFRRSRPGVRPRPDVSCPCVTPMISQVSWSISCPGVDRLVRRDGIHLFGLRYWDDVLSIWAGRLDRPLRVSYDPRDLSRVFVRAPDGIRWPIHFADLRRPPITLGEHRRAQAALREARLGAGR